MPNLTLDSLIKRVRTEVAKKDEQSAKRKIEARIERQRRAEQPSAYQQESYWYPVAIHREYETQLCDVCKTETTYFNRDKVELRHRLDRSARRFIHERGEGMQDLPMHIEILERVIPECFACLTAGKVLNHLFRKNLHASKETPKDRSSPAHPSNPEEGGGISPGQPLASPANPLGDDRGGPIEARSPEPAVALR